jgi:hypothetical protein
LTVKKQLALFLISIVLTAIACNLTRGRGAPTETPPTNSIGTLSRVSDAVEHNDNPVAGVDPLFENDSVRVFGGGEGLLDFGGGLLLRAFNDTILGGVTVASDPGAPLDVRMLLESGGFTGHLTVPGGKATFQTPGGATISVLGTEFLLVYDPASRLTTVGNFDGTLGVAAGGISAVVAPDHYREVPSGGQPGQELPLTFSQAEYEGRSRDLRSPVLALEQPATQPASTPTLIQTPTLHPTETGTTTATPIQSPSPPPTFTPTNTLAIPDEVYPIFEEFENPEIFTSTDPDSVYISDGLVFWDISRSAGQQFVYREIPRFSGDVKLTVRGQVNSWTNNCFVHAGIGDRLKEPPENEHLVELAVKIGFIGGGCGSDEPNSPPGAVVMASGVELDMYEPSICIYTGNWLRIDPGVPYSAELTVAGEKAILNVLGVGTSTGTRIYNDDFSLLYVGLSDAGDWPGCSGTIDSVVIEPLDNN